MYNIFVQKTARRLRRCRRRRPREGKRRASSTAGRREAMELLSGDTALAGEPTWLRLRRTGSATPRHLVLTGPVVMRGKLNSEDLNKSLVHVTVTIRLAGEYVLQVEDENGRTMLRTPLIVQSGRPHIASCILKSSSAHGRVHVLQVRDAHGNNLSLGGTPLGAATGSTPSNVCDHRDGTYTIRVPDEVGVGPHTLRIWQLQAETSESQLRVPVYISPTPAKIAVSAWLTPSPSHWSEATVGEPIAFTLQAFDVFGVACRLDPSAVSVRLAGAVAQLQRRQQTHAGALVGADGGRAEQRESADATPTESALHGQLVPERAGVSELTVLLHSSSAPSASTISPRVLCSMAVAVREAMAVAVSEAQQPQGVARVRVWGHAGKWDTATAGDWIALNVALIDSSGSSNGLLAQSVLLSICEARGDQPLFDGACRELTEGADDLRGTPDREVPLQHAERGPDGEFRLRFMLRHAGSHSLTVHISQQEQATLDVDADATGKRAGPWVLRVTPGPACLATSLAAAQLPLSVFVGTAFSAIVPIIDRFGNSLPQRARVAEGATRSQASMRSSPVSMRCTDDREARVAEGAARTPRQRLPPSSSLAQSVAAASAPVPEVQAVFEPVGSGEGIACSVQMAGKESAAAVRVRVAAAECGKYRLVLRANGGDPVHSKEVTVLAGALDASRCVAEGRGLLRATLGRPSSFVIKARDAAGNNRRCVRIAPFRVSLLRGPGTIDTRMTMCEDGSFQVVYTPYGSEGEYMIAVTYAAARISGSPFRIRVSEPGKASASNSKLRPASMGASRARPRYASTPLTKMQAGQSSAVQADRSSFSSMQVAAQPTRVSALQYARNARRDVVCVASS